MRDKSKRYVLLYSLHMFGQDDLQEIQTPHQAFQTLHLIEPCWYKIQRISLDALQEPLI